MQYRSFWNETTKDIHSLLIEQQVRYLKEAGLDSFYRSTNLLIHLKERSYAYLQKNIRASHAGISTDLFKDVQFSKKSLLIVQKRGKGAKQVSQVLLGISQNLRTEKNSENSL